MRLIKAGALKLFIDEEVEEDKMPSIDIVRCKECIYRPLIEDPADEPCKFNLIAPAAGGRCPCLVADGWYSWMPPDDFYCAYGKRIKGD